MMTRQQNQKMNAVILYLKMTRQQEEERRRRRAKQKTKKNEKNRNRNIIIAPEQQTTQITQKKKNRRTRPRQGLTDQKKARSDVVEKREISTIVYTCYFPLTGKYKPPSEEFLNRKSEGRCDIFIYILWL